MSSPINSFGIRDAGTVRRGASSVGSGAATASSGSWMTTPRSSARFRADSTSSNRSGSTKLLPISPP